MKFKPGDCIVDNKYPNEIDKTRYGLIYSISKNKYIIIWDPEFDVMEWPVRIVDEHYELDIKRMLTKEFDEQLANILK